MAEQTITDIPHETTPQDTPLTDTALVPMEEGEASDDGTSAGDAAGSTTQVIRDQAGKLGSQATDRLRAFADDGKARATSALNDVAKLIEDAAGQVDEKVGPQFGGYVRSAANAVTSVSDGLRDKDVDEMLDDAREFIRKSPGIAIGAAATVGFVLARLVRAGTDAHRDA